MRERASFNLERICGDSGLVRRICYRIEGQFIFKRAERPEFLGLTAAQLAEVFGGDELRPVLFTVSKPTLGQVKALAGRLPNVFVKMGLLHKTMDRGIPYFWPKHPGLSESEYRAALVYRNDENRLSQVRQRLEILKVNSAEFLNQIMSIEEWIETESQRHSENYSGEAASRALEALETAAGR